MLALFLENPWRTCEEPSIEDYTDATKFVGRYMYTSSFLLFIRSIKYFKFVSRNHLSLFLFYFPTILSLSKDWKILEFGGKDIFTFTIHYHTLSCLYHLHPCLIQFFQPMTSYYLISMVHIHLTNSLVIQAMRRIKI